MPWGTELKINLCRQSKSKSRNLTFSISSLNTWDRSPWTTDKVQLLHRVFRALQAALDLSELQAGHLSLSSVSSMFFPSHHESLHILHTGYASYVWKLFPFSKTPFSFPPSPACCSLFVILHFLDYSIHTLNYSLTSHLSHTHSIYMSTYMYIYITGMWGLWHVYTSVHMCIPVLDLGMSTCYCNVKQLKFTCIWKRSPLIPFFSPQRSEKDKGSLRLKSLS